MWISSFSIKLPSIAIKPKHNLHNLDLGPLSGNAVRVTQTCMQRAQEHSLEIDTHDENR